MENAIHQISGTKNLIPKTYKIEIVAKDDFIICQKYNIKY